MKVFVLLNFEAKRVAEKVGQKIFVAKSMEGLQLTSGRRWVNSRSRQSPYAD